MTSEITVIKTNDEKLINAIMDSVSIKLGKYPFKTGYTVGYLDVLYLLGISKTKLDSTLEVLMTSEELKKYDEVVKNITNNVRCPRIVIGKDDDELLIRFNGMQAYLALALSKRFPNKRIRAIVDEEMFEFYYSFLNGAVTYSNTDRIIKTANYLRTKDAYTRCVRALMPVAISGDANAFNDIGACYERIGDMDSAAADYYRANLPLAKINLLKLFDNKKIKFNKSMFMEACDYLVDKQSEKGYLYRSYYYQGLYGSGKDAEKAIAELDEGIRVCGEVDELVFEKGYVYESMFDSKDEKAQAVSHDMYGRLIRHETSGYVTTARYNYGLQCLFGRGCDKDVDQAILWLTQAALAGYSDAIDKLVEIYSSEEGYINPELQSKWEERRMYLYCDEEEYDDYE